MAHEVQGVVARAKGEPVEVETIAVPDPGPGEALVEVQACGVCHTDLHYREGAINDDFPFLLGHEAAGRGRGGGPGRHRRRARRLRRPQLAGGVRRVPGLPAGPAVVLLRHPQRHAEDDARRRRAEPGARHRRLRREDARRRRPGDQGRPSRPEPEAAGLLGCGVMAGLGAAMFTGEVGRGDSVAVFGCGGVGDAAIAGARLAGAAKIIAVDLDARKLELAEAFGATHTVDASTVDPVEAIRELTDGYGADVCIEAVGNPKVLEQAFYARDLAGTVVQVGVPDPEMRIDLPMIDFFGRGGRLKPSWYGDCLPEPGLPDAHRPVPAGPARPRPLRQRDHRARRGRGGVPPHGARRGAALGRRPRRSVLMARVDRVVTSGTFSIDGEDFDVDNNIWLVGDDDEVLVIDAAHDHRPIVDGVAGRRVVAIVCTHGHNDHINAAVALADDVGAPILAAPRRHDAVGGRVPRPARRPQLADGDVVSAGGVDLAVLHTPGHSPGGCCLHDAADDVLFSGDTLFNGGPGATGRSFSDRPTILRSIRDRLLPLPGRHRRAHRPRRRHHDRRRGGGRGRPSCPETPARADGPRGARSACGSG